MKKAVFLIIIAAISLAGPITAAAAAPVATPAAALSGELSDAVQSEDGSITFHLKVNVSEATAQYSALDFSLISSNFEKLQIVDNARTNEEKNLAIAFPGDYGNAYHNGRVDENNNQVEYLVGIFSQSPENTMQPAQEVCDITLLYSGEEPQTISLAGLQLVYFDNGVVTNKRLDDTVSLEISKDTLRVNNNWLANLDWKLVLIVVLVLAVGALIFVRRRPAKS